MQHLIETVFRLDEAEDVVGLNNFIAQNQYSSNQVFVLLFPLLSRGRLQSAYVLAMILHQAGLQHIHVSLALCAGGLLYRKPDDETLGLRLLQEQMASQPGVINTELLTPVMVGILNAMLQRPEEGLFLRIVEILKIIAPPFRQIFDWNAPIPELSLEKMRQGRPAEMPLVINPVPPADAPRPQRRVLILLKQFGTELRYKKAMTHYGWQAEIYHELPLTEASAAADCQRLAEVCRQKKIDVLFFDVRPFWQWGAQEGSIAWNSTKVRFLFKQGMQAFLELKAQLRQENPAFRVFGVLFDSSDEIERTVLEGEQGFFDGLMSLHHNPSAPHILDNPQYKQKILHNYFGPVNKHDFCNTDRPLVPNMYFRGTIAAGHWVRLLWISAAARFAVPIVQKLNKLEYDKQAPLDDYAAYMSDLSEATCCLSIVMSRFVTRYLTYRSFEVPLSGALLVQDFTPLMHHYFIPGEHYLEFSTIAELAAIARFITERREEAEAVRRRGHAFARAHYNDETIIGQIDKFLYH
ncbi:MAG: glycosyltransferase family 1 protein [Magnetococcales bacterium]|nr:glycosyltransferase family 1 protein [Magnetococcales bacterium]